MKRRRRRQHGGGRRRIVGPGRRISFAAMLAAGLGLICSACSDLPADNGAAAGDQAPTVRTRIADTCNPPSRIAIGGPGNALGGAFIGAGGLGSLGAGPTTSATTDVLEGTSGSSMPSSSTGCIGADRPVTPETKAGGAE